MGDISTNFNKRELSCPCCGMFIENPILIEGLQLVRDDCGCPVFVNSGTRCVPHNVAVGGGDNSFHLRGLAADIRPHKSITLLTFYRLILTIPQFKNGGVGLYPLRNFVHVDVRSEKARWCQLRGPEYLPIAEAVAYLENQG